MASGANPAHSNVKRCNPPRWAASAPVSQWVSQFGLHPGTKRGKDLPGKGLDNDAPPMISIPEMFETMMMKAMLADRPFLDKVVHDDSPCLTLTVATVCSGTEAPLTALNFIKEASRKLFRRDILDFHHQFSCEIEPYKQAFIRRNHDPPLIFRNVVELGAKNATTAMDASGCEKSIPVEPIDMLIAGTSCVDFSTLNNKKDQKTKVNAFSHYPPEDLTGKTISDVGLDPEFQAAVNNQLSPEGLEGLGESMTTFLSTLNFIMEKRPSMVIFENVQTAPWKAMQNFWLPRAGYAAEFVKLNSKDFYVPQERLRGYLVALDAPGFPDVDVSKIVSAAILKVPKMAQRASSSVLDFLLEDDDPAVLQSRDEMTRYGVLGVPKEGKSASTGKNIDWDFNQVRHSIHSQRWNLDTIRRFSKATLSHGKIVSITPPAHSWIGYWARETPRVIDLFDNVYQLMRTRAGCDMNFKAAMFNISQSLDRMPITVAKFGIAPIITPSGMPTLSMGARPLLGVECLALQGIPRNHLRLGGESHKELRDLAGNAMTATVVGAVILATFIAASSALERRPLQPYSQQTANTSFFEPLERGLKESSDWAFGNFRLDTTSLEVYGCFKTCQCPPVGSHNRITFRCRDCGKLACQLCKANPPHNFELFEHSSGYLTTAELKVHLQQSLPGVFRMQMRDDGFAFFRSMKDRRGNALYRATVKALLSYNVFYFAGIKVSTASVLVEYRSESSIARLTMTRLGGADWYIFPSHSEPLGSSRIGVRERHATPVAKGSICNPRSSLDPETALWSVWERVEHTWRVVVATKEDHYFVLNHRAMQSLTSPPAHLEAHVRNMIRGRWCAKPDCGTPEDSLYVRDDASSKKFLFKDVDPIGHPANDNFIFSEDVEAGAYAWLPRRRGCTSTVSAEGHGPGGLPVSRSLKEKWSYAWYHIPTAELGEFSRSVLFAANGLGRGHVFKPRRTLRFDADRGMPVHLCHDCCVEPPQLHWIKGNTHVVPWEDPNEIRSYEAKVKAMPSAFTARVRLDPDQPLLESPAEAANYGKSGAEGQLLVFRMGGILGNDGLWEEPRVPSHDLHVQLAANPRTLASRAAANLVYGCRPRRYSPDVLSKVQCFYQVELGTLLGPDIRFTRFYDSIPTTEDTTGLGDSKLSGEVRLDLFKNKKWTLHEHQVPSVKWMLAREEDSAPYPETESEELVFEDLNLRVVGRAIYLNDGSATCCRGGVVAHDIGYGKTVVMIALLELRRHFDREKSILERHAAASRSWESKLSFIHLRATLVIVPDHITLQWKEEFEKFGCTATIVVIKRYNDLVKKPLSVLEEADVIIVPTSLLKTSTYKERLVALTSNRPKGGKSNREVGDRYRESVETIRKVVTQYHRLPPTLSDVAKEDHANDMAKEILAEANREYEALSRRWVWAGGRKDANRRQQQGNKGIVEDEDIDEEPKKKKKDGPLWTTTSCLENFSFARILVDEISYDNPEVALFFTSSLANAKWLLSGTPRCGNLADIVHLGRLLSVHIARPDPCVPTYLDPITFGPSEKPNAPSEEYRLRASHLRSNNFAFERHQAAEVFVQHFMRQDKVDRDQFQFETRKMDIELPTLSRIAYCGLQHDLSVAMGNIFNLPFALRRSLGIAKKCSYTGDNVATGTKAADFMMARLAAIPIGSNTLLALLGAADLEILTLEVQLKTGLDKLTWLCHRISLVREEIRDKYPRHHYMRTLVEDVFMALADARDGWNKWPTASYGGVDAFSQLGKALCPSSSFRYQGGGLENWDKWRYTEAKSFWPDWYDMPDEYIDELAAPEARAQLVDLSIDAILLSISHPLGRSFARTGGDGWLDSHAKVLGRVMDERTRANFLSTRQPCATEQSRAAAARDTVPKLSTEQLVKFLKACMEEKRKAFEGEVGAVDKMAEKDKADLQRHCLRRNVAFVDSNGARRLAEKLMGCIQGKGTKKDFLDKRGVISPRTAFPIPNHIFERRGGKTEAMLEELTVTYNYLSNCQEAWIGAFRRLRLYNFLRFVQYCRDEGAVEKQCDACLRGQVCTRNVPGFLVVACGHWLCEQHAGEIDEKAENGFCPAIGCGAPCGLSHPATIKLTESGVLDCPNVWDAEDQLRCSQGGKAPAIVSLIKEIPHDDHVVLFTYVEELAVSVQDKLVDEDISVLSMVGTGPDANMAEILGDFKEGKAKVIIIDPTAEHAAGSNLVVANHVIFASPVLERDPFRQRMQYRQAVGRCLRQGQEKKVFVYTFVSKGTIDEELYECQVQAGDA
ncbi:hypothetical protein GE09DRAFT_1263776 [Coniochaeta sp. 2T2.1]|nr:hypothetical protein GE09DRAFT_1263776 [Coniochaeta sp. 2T2.1]